MDHHILITAAVAEELERIAEIMKQTGNLIIGNRNVTEGRLGIHTIRIVASGPGLVNTIQAITACIENQKPTMIIQTGCGGAFRESGLRIGDIGIAEEEVDVHLGIEPESPHAAVKGLPFPVMIKQHVSYQNRYECHKTLADFAENCLTQKMQHRGIQIKKGPFVTVATITATDARATGLFHDYAATMEAMEGSGAAHLAIFYDIPFLEIRAVSNMVGQRKRSEWNLPLACARCNEAVISFLTSWESGEIF